MRSTGSYLARKIDEENRRNKLMKDSLKRKEEQNSKK